MNKISHREFFRVFALSTAGVSTVTSKPTGSTKAPGKETTLQPPSLDEMVTAGSLASLCEHSAENPSTTPAIEQVDGPNGIIRRGFQDIWDHWDPAKHNNHALCWFDEEQVVQPGIAESWQVNADASEWTFHIRPGIRCYDGSPLDSDSFRWSWENLYLNETLTTTPPSNLSTGNPKVMGEMTFPDRYTFRIKYQEPRPTLLFGLGLWRHFWTPGAYMEQFHQDFADKSELETKVTQAGFETWEQLFDDQLYGHVGSAKPEDESWSADSAFLEEISEIRHSPYLCATDLDGEGLPKGHWLCEIRELGEQIAVEPDADRRQELFERIEDIWAEKLPHFDDLRESPTGTRAKNSLPPNDTIGDKYLLNTETYFWDDPDTHA